MLEWSEDPKRIPKGITLSDQQEAIRTKLKHKSRRGIEKGNDVRVACFNNSIENELKHRFTPATDVRTNNKIGYHTFLEWVNFAKTPYRFIRKDKYKYIIKDFGVDPYNDDKQWPLFIAINDVVSMARNTMRGEFHRQSGTVSEDTVTWSCPEEDLIEMMGFYSMGIKQDLWEKVLELTPKVINQGIRSLRRYIDFTDQIWLCNALGLKPPKKRRLYLDEAQDCNAMQHVLLQDTAEQYVIVGDIYQSIYGFAGAHPASMQELSQSLGSIDLPLTVTRRCPHSHVERAKTYLPDTFASMFKAPDSSPQGSVDYEKFNPEFYRRIQESGETNLFMCRLNAPLVAAAFSCWKNRIPAIIRGRDMAKEIASTIERFSNKKRLSNAETVIKVEEHFEELINGYQEEDKDDLAQAAEDKCEIIVTFLVETNTIADAISAVWNMFDDQKEDDNLIQFSTVHKAKGLEAQVTGILKPGTMPLESLCQKSDYWARQEYNIHYVCNTRGQNKLYVQQS